MSTSLLKFHKRLSMNLFVVVGITAIAVLIPCPVSAMPTTLLEPAPSSQLPSPGMNDKVTFDFVFGIGKSKSSLLYVRGLLITIALPSTPYPHHRRRRVRCFQQLIHPVQ